MSHLQTGDPGAGEVQGLENQRTNGVDSSLGLMA